MNDNQHSVDSRENCYYPEEGYARQTYNGERVRVVTMRDWPEWVPKAGDRVQHKKHGGPFTIQTGVAEKDHCGVWVIRATNGYTYALRDLEPYVEPEVVVSVRLAPGKTEADLRVRLESIGEVVSEA